MMEEKKRREEEEEKREEERRKNMILHLTTCCFKYFGKEYRVYSFLIYIFLFLVKTISWPDTPSRFCKRS